MTQSFVQSSLLVASFAAVLFALPAAAGGAAPAPLSKALSGEAKAAYDSGRLLFDDGDTLGALAKFSHSYDVSHDARLLWNMATCEKELRHYGRAATLIDRYLREGGTTIAAEQRQSALNMKNALRAFYVDLKLYGVPEGATLLIDGNQVGRAPFSEPLLVDLGPRTVRVEQPGFEPNETKLEVAGGGDLAVTVTLKRVASPLPRLSIVTSGAVDIVAVDGKVVASQRWEGPVAIGDHTVRVTAPHKKPYEVHLQLLAGSTRSLRITLEDENHGSNLWLWVSGGAAIAAGTAVAGYFLLKPKDDAAAPAGKLMTVFVPAPVPAP
jgi:hypothetical protein